MDEEQRLLGKIEEFMRVSENRHNELKNETKDEFTKVNEKLDSLREFKWRVIGGAGVMVMLIEILLAVFERIGHGS